MPFLDVAPVSKPLVRSCCVLQVSDLGVWVLQITKYYCPNMFRISDMGLITKPYDQGRLHFAMCTRGLCRSHVAQQFNEPPVR